MGAYFRAKQAVGLLKPQLYVTLPACVQAVTNVQQVCISYLELPQICNYECDEQNFPLSKRLCIWVKAVRTRKGFQGFAA